jgi:hypothetical protein
MKGSALADEEWPPFKRFRCILLSECRSRAPPLYFPVNSEAGKEKEMQKLGDLARGKDKMREFLQRIAKPSNTRV